MNKDNCEKNEEEVWKKQRTKMLGRTRTDIFQQLLPRLKRSSMFKLPEVRAYQHKHNTADKQGSCRQISMGEFGMWMEICIFVTTKMEVYRIFIVRKTCHVCGELGCYSYVRIRFLTDFIRMGWNADALTHHDHDYVNYSHASFY